MNVSYILETIKSCKTFEQLTTCKQWAEKLAKRQPQELAKIKIEVEIKKRRLQEGGTV